MDGDTAGDREAAAEGSLWICDVVPPWYSFSWLNQRNCGLKNMFCLALLSPDSHRPPPLLRGGCLIPIKNNLIRSIPTISFTNRVNRGGCGCVSEWAQRLSGIYPILTHEFNNWIHFHSNGPLILSVQGIHQTPTSSPSKTCIMEIRRRTTSLNRSLPWYL